MNVEEALKIHDRLASGYSEYARQFEGGTGLAVGCEGIEYRWKADLIRMVVSKILEGGDLAEIEKEAKETALDWVAKHNARRPKDMNWQRWEGSAFSAIESVCRDVHQARESEGI